jgi:hypothetical protein
LARATSDLELLRPKMSIAADLTAFAFTGTEQTEHGHTMARID